MHITFCATLSHRRLPSLTAHPILHLHIHAPLNEPSETSKGVKQLAESMQKMADQQKDLEEQSGLEPPDPSGLLHALDIIEDELVALEKEREMVLDRYEKTVIHRLTNIHKECVVPSTKLVSAAGKKLKHLAKANAKFEDVQKKGGGPAAQLKSQEALEKAVDEEEESHQELVQKLIHIEFIKHDEMRRCVCVCVCVCVVAVFVTCMCCVWGVGVGVCVQ